MKRSSRIWMLLACVGLAAVLAFQTDHWRVDAQEVPEVADQRLDVAVPPAALLTDRGRELAENLRNLRRTRDNLGKKHPTRPVIERAISETERQLRAWLPSEEDSDNPFKKLDSPKQLPHPTVQTETENPVMNETDLRQWVLRLQTRIERLEERIQSLEKARN